MKSKLILFITFLTIALFCYSQTNKYIVVTFSAKRGMDKHFINYYWITPVSYTHLPILPLTGWSGSPIFYNEVTEYKGLKSANVGKTVYKFTQDFESSYPGAEEEDVPVPVPLRFYSGLYNNDEGIVPVSYTHLFFLFWTCFFSG